MNKLRRLKIATVETLRVVWTRPMLTVFAMGFASGLPLLLTLRTLQAWMTDAGVDLKTIGIFALVGLPYSLKFVWAPLLDRYIPSRLGRRRGWLIISQVALGLSLAAMAMIDPKVQLEWLALLSIAVCFFSATQDIAVDAYRREVLTDAELGLGSSLYNFGYRIGMLYAGAFALFLADVIDWPTTYGIMALSIAACLFITVLAHEPKIAAAIMPHNLRDAVVKPFVEFLGRSGALWILAFILFYKMGDAMAGAMATPFYLKMGFSKTEISAIAKSLGFFAAIVGGFAGGVMVLRLGIKRSLWICGFLQAASTLCFSILAEYGEPSRALLAVVISFEDLSAGMGSAAFAAFMASLCNVSFTATQYALLTSVMGVPRTVLSTPSGYMAETLGWVQFFVVCTLIAVPGMLLLLKVAPWRDSPSWSPIIEPQSARSPQRFS